MSGMYDGLQYLRKWNLIASDKSGEGLDLSPLRCSFLVKKTDSQTPNEAEFSIYNISKATSNKLKKSFTKIIFSAGYQANYGLIFSGNIISFEQSKDGPNSVLKIKAGDGDEAYNYTVINKTLAAGATPDQIIKEASGAMGVPIGYKSELRKDALPRGKVMYGAPHAVLREQSANQKCTWSIQDGELLILKRTEVKKGTAILLSKDSGLLGLPSLNEDGVAATCLLNPKLKIGSVVELESEYLDELNGQYRLISIEHKGDTQSNEWISNFTGLNVNNTNAKDKVSKK